MLVVERKSIKVNRRDQTFITHRHDEFPNTLLHSVERRCNTCDSPTNEEQKFPRDENSVTDAQTDNNDNDERELPNLSSDLREDINRIMSEGCLVDDDNDPVVENTPTNDNNNEDCVCGNWLGNAPEFCARKVQVEDKRRQH